MKRFPEVFGNARLKEILSIRIDACLKTNEQFPHTLFYGFPGMGKSLLCKSIPKEFSSFVAEHTSGAILNDVIGLYNYLKVFRQLEKFKFLIIEEIDEMPVPVQKVFYTVLTEFKLDTVIAGKIRRVDIEPFSCLATTNNPEKLSAAIRRRFRLKEHIDTYSPEEITLLCISQLEKDKLKYDSADIISGIVKVGKLNPDNTLTIIDNLKAVMEGKIKKVVTKEILDEVLRLLDIKHGLNSLDRKYLKELVAATSPIGLRTLSDLLGEPQGTIEEIIEPYLLQQGWVERTSRGRLITDKGLEFIRGIYEKGE